GQDTRRRSRRGQAGGRQQRTQQGQQFLFHPHTLAEYRVPSTEYRVPSTEYRVPSTEYRVPSTEYRVLSTEYSVAYSLAVPKSVTSNRSRLLEDPGCASRAFKTSGKR